MEGTNKWTYRTDVPEFGLYSKSEKKKKGGFCIKKSWMKYDDKLSFVLSFCPGNRIRDKE